MCGDDRDSHAGTNETSLMLACCPELVAEGYSEVPASKPAPHTGGASFVAWLARVVKFFGGDVLSRDLEHLANTLAWVGDPDMLSLIHI